MTLADDIAMAAFQSDEEFRRVMDKVIKKDLGSSITEFGERSRILAEHVVQDLQRRSRSRT